MEAKTERKPKGDTAAKRALWPAVWAAVLLLVSAVALYGVYRAVTGSLDQANIRSMQETAERELMLAQSAILDREKAVMDWVNMVRNGKRTDMADILEEVRQGNQMLGSERLFLVDRDLFYYGSSGTITHVPEYNSYLQNMDTDMLHEDGSNGEGRLLVCGRVKPFAVDDQTFAYALAEFSQESFYETLMRNSYGEEMRSIIRSNGDYVVHADANSHNFFSMMEGVTFEGFSSPEELKKAMAENDRLAVTFYLEGEDYVLTSARMQERDWIFLTLRPMDGSSSLTELLLALFLVLAGLMTIAAGGAVFLIFRVRALRERLLAAETNAQMLQESLQTAQQTSQAQAAFLNHISYDVRTPLHTIAGFTALAARHVEEPEMVRGYLEKVTGASKQLLSRLDEGLGKGPGQKEKTPELSPAEEKAVDLSGKRILLVEDNTLNREITAEVLSEAGVAVECAENGQQGFYKVSVSRPGYFDLVLMDIQMPVMDGCEAAKTIRRLRNKKLAEIPIIAMTASVSDEDRQRAFQAGMDGYVEKPIDIERLLVTVRNILTQKDRYG